MSNDFRRQIEDIVEALKGAKQRGHACSLLVGAGCSVEGGIPTAVRFIELIRARHPRAYDRAATKTYPACMAELSPSERHALIAEQVDAALINWAHIGIALLMQHGYVDRILTTNFDPLIIRACALIGEFPAVYDFAASQEFKPDYVPDKAVFYLHGQRTGFRLMNTADEVEALSRSLAPVFEDAGRGRAWVVVGYSGDNDPVFEQLARVQRFDHQLFWVGYRDGEPSEHVRKRLLVSGKYAFFVSGHTADSFFVQLTQQLGIFPPAFVARPFTHLDEQLQRLAPYTPPGGTGGMDALDLAKEWISGAQRVYEQPRDGGDDHDERDAVPGQIVQSFMEGDYDHVIDLAAQELGLLPEEARDAVAWAYVSSAIQLADPAQGGSVEDATLFETVRARFATALLWKPEFPEVWYNWGVALSSRAKVTCGADAEVLLQEAEEKFAKALAEKPDDHEALYSWGAALADRAKLTSGVHAEALLREAEEKYTRALTVKPGDPISLYNWGSALSSRAKLTSGTDAERLLREAEEKYAQAVAAKPDFREALNNWGSVLSARAKLTSGTAAEVLLREAEEKYAQAEEISPGKGAYNMACIRALQGDAEGARQWLQASADAGLLPSVEHLGADADLDSLRASGWFQEFLRARAAEDHP
jgi:tetratricopeptide (TPR) repeat protein